MYKDIVVFMILWALFGFVGAIWGFFIIVVGALLLVHLIPKK